MFCNQCQELVSDYIDGALELGEQLQVERHLADCEACRAVRDDLLQIVHFSRQLPLQTPSGAVWARIRFEVASEQPASVWYRTARRLSTMRSRHFDVSIPQLVASAAALVIVASVTVTLLRRQVPADLTTGGSSLLSMQDRSLLSHRDMVQMEERINELTETVEQRKRTWDPELREAFQRNMIYVDQSLAECRHDLADNPADDVSQELMLGVYREKVRLLASFSEF
jgi:anti-sigma-K factor RskA